MQKWYFKWLSAMKFSQMHQRNARLKALEKSRDEPLRPRSDHMSR